MIDLLKQAAPNVRRIAVVRTASTTEDQLQATAEAARLHALGLVTVSVAEGYDRAFGSPLGDVATGILQLGTPGFMIDAPDFAIAAQKHRLPTIAGLKAYISEGVLITYGPRTETYFPRAVIIADRILRGEKPGDIPIERPTEFELAVNLKTARALGIDISPSLLARADEVIE